MWTSKTFSYLHFPYFQFSIHNCYIKHLLICNSTRLEKQLNLSLSLSLTFFLCGSPSLAGSLSPASVKLPSTSSLLPRSHRLIPLNSGTLCRRQLNQSTRETPNTGADFSLCGPGVSVSGKCVCILRSRVQDCCFAACLQLSAKPLSYSVEQRQNLS